MKNAVILLVWALALSVFAEESRYYPVYRMENAPQIDGELDDAVWNKIPLAGGFFVFRGNGEYAVEKPTEFRAGWTQDAIYLAIRCVESDPGKIQSRYKDEGALDGDDSVELLFSPMEGPSWVQLIVNAKGSRCNGRYSSSGPEKVWGWEAKTKVGANYWNVEIKVPMGVIGMAPGTGARWRVNIARNLLTGPPGERFTAWPLLSKGFHELARFGVFEFKETVLNEAEAGKASQGNEKFYGEFLKKQLGIIQSEAGKYRKALDQGAEMERLKAESEELGNLWTLTGRLSTGSCPWWEMSEAFPKCSKLIERSEDFKAKVNLEKLF